MDKPARLGGQETEVLRFVAERAPIAARDVALRWGEPRGLARTTVSTILERLRQKGYLIRRAAEDGSLVYEPTTPKAELLRTLVQGFVEKTLGGSTAPLVAYLADTKNLTAAEREELRRLAEQLSQAPAEVPAAGAGKRRRK